MPSLPIPFGQTENQGIEEMSGAAPLSANVVMDAGKAIRKRPAVVAWDDFPAPAVVSEVIGIWVFGDYLVYVTADRKIHAWLAPGLVLELSDATAATQLDGDRRPTATVTHTRIVICGGGAPQKWEGSGLSARLGGLPPNATHVVDVASRIVLNPRGNDGIVEWSDPFAAGEESWRGLVQELDSKPDPCIAVYDNTAEVIGFGTRTTTFLDPDPSAGFVIARVLNTGMHAPYSFTDDDENLRWIDHKSRIVESDGRGVTPISSPGLAKTLRGLRKDGLLADAWSFTAAIDAFNIAAWVLPTAGRVFVYNTEAKTWSEWFGRSDGRWATLGISSYCYFPQLDLHLVGRADGTINQLTFDEFSDNVGEIYADMVTGFLDRGTKRLKQTQSLKLTFRHTPGTLPRVFVYWRDDTGAYQGPKIFDIDRSGTVEVRSLGTYRQRQWRMTYSDNAPLVLVDAVEDYEQLEI